MKLRVFQKSGSIICYNLLEENENWELITGIATWRSAATIKSGFTGVLGMKMWLSDVMTDFMCQPD